MNPGLDSIKNLWKFIYKGTIDWQLTSYQNKAYQKTVELFLNIGINIKYIVNVKSALNELKKAF